MSTTKGVKVKYKGSTIHDMPGDGEFKLLTKASYLEDDIDIQVDRDANLDSKTITANGSYSAASDELDGYDEVTVNVPNSYSASDEGKVVDDGALVAQTSTTKNANGTYDTTLNSEVVVNVPNTYTQSDEGKVVSNGALVAQTSTTKTANGTYDTTLNNEVVVDVAGGGGTLISKSISANGIYNAQDDNADGYSQVTVNVSGGSGGVINLAIPQMTSDTAPSGEASASSVLDTNFKAFRAFDRTSAGSNMRGGWLASASDTEPWIRYDFSSPVSVYQIDVSTANNGATATKTVTIEGLKNGEWENALKTGSTATLTFTQGTYGSNCVLHQILLNGETYDAIRIKGNEKFYYGANQTACTFSEIQVYEMRS